jgi:hypothetical protein
MTPASVPSVAGAREWCGMPVRARSSVGHSPRGKTLMEASRYRHLPIGW